VTGRRYQGTAAPISAKATASLADARPAGRALLRGAARPGLEVATGLFGARMEVALVDGRPVTLVLDG
jgi:D-Tyr-tRNAtyr deacylase